MGAVVVGITLLVYWNDLLIVANEGLVSTGFTHVLILPFLVGYLVYRKRRILSASINLHRGLRTIDSSSVEGLSLMATAVAVYLYGSQTTYSLEWRLFTLPIFVSGLVIAVFGYDFFRKLLFPIALLFFTEPYLIQLTNPIWEDLAWISAIGAQGLLTLVGLKTTLVASVTGPMLQTTGSAGAQLAFDIGVGSSGLQSLVGFTLFATFAAYLLIGPTWRRITLMIIGYPLLLLLNVVRISVIIGLANAVGSAASDIFHLTGGLILVFLATLLLLVVGERFFKLRLLNIPSVQPSCQHATIVDSICLSCGRVFKRKAATFTRHSVGGIILAALVVALLLPVQTPAYAQAKLPTDVNLSSGTPAQLTTLLPAVPGWRLGFQYSDTGTAAALEEDAALVFAYQANNTSNANQTKEVYAIVQIGPLYHTWEASLVTHPAQFGFPTATVLDDQQVTIPTGVTGVTGRLFAFIRPGQQTPEAVLEWTVRTPVLIGTSYEERFVMFSIWSTIPALQQSGLITNSSDFGQVLNVYLPFAEGIAAYWRTAENVTSINLNPALLPLTFFGVLFLPQGALALDRLEKRSRYRRAASRTTRDLLSGDERELLSSAKATRGGRLSIDSILRLFPAGPESALGDGPMSTVRLLERTGVIRSTIADVEDVPYMGWRVNYAPKSNRKNDEGDR